MIGIPYAYSTIRDGRLYRVCPVCGEHILEETDPMGEAETNNYGNHYAKEHGEPANG